MPLIDFEDWKGVTGLSCIAKKGDKFTCKFEDKSGKVITVDEIYTINFEEFPNEPLPQIMNVRVTKSPEKAYVTGFTDTEAITGDVTILTANFKEPARVRREIMSLFIFKE